MSYGKAKKNTHQLKEVRVRTQSSHFTLRKGGQKKLNDFIKTAFLVTDTTGLDFQKYK